MKKQTLKEEVSSIKSMMQKIDEQSFLNKVKEKIQGTFAKKDSQPDAPQDKPRTYEALKAEWSKVNSDTTNMNGFGEGKSYDMQMAGTMAEMNARAAILKKLGVSQASFGSEIVDEALFQNKDKSYIKLIILSANNIVKK